MASKTLTILGVVALGLAVSQSPTLKATASDAIHTVTGKAVTSSTDQASFERICPLVDAYFTVDGAGQKATGKAIVALAKDAAVKTDDPAVSAFLVTIPAALVQTKSAQSTSAKALVGRECSAHGEALTHQ